MINILKQLLGIGPKVNVKELIQNGAVILDVRTPGEFAGGHVKGAVNIPLDQVYHKLDKIKKMNKPIVTCCASGMRSGTAASYLKNNGVEAYNGGSWGGLR